TVTMTARTRNRSVSRVSRIRASRYWASTGAWLFRLRKRRSNSSLRSVRFSTVCLSIERTSESRHRDGHGEQHQRNERDRIILQIGQRRTLQHDGPDDSHIVRERQSLADILRPY